LASESWAFNEAFSPCCRKISASRKAFARKALSLDDSGGGGGGGGGGNKGFKSVTGVEH